MSPTRTETAPAPYWPPVTVAVAPLTGPILTSDEYMTAGNIAQVAFVLDVVTGHLSTDRLPSLSNEDREDYIERRDLWFRRNAGWFRTPRRLGWSVRHFPRYLTDQAKTEKVLQAIAG